MKAVKKIKIVCKSLCRKTPGFEWVASQSEKELVFKAFAHLTPNSTHGELTVFPGEGRWVIGCKQSHGKEKLTNSMRLSLLGSWPHGSP
ncbi:hypothetical protein [Oligoflexus tunisiensis]|uniref:hypothetical protein n=1 Tax=Oligoflexus tunisiensis TaxID=708132 RepID=UPI001C407EE4|nr:hypothetical protein [Oligoflexus tunisiensis]